MKTKLIVHKAQDSSILYNKQLYVTVRVDYLLTCGEH